MKVNFLTTNSFNKENSYKTPSFKKADFFVPIKQINGMIKYCANKLDGNIDLSRFSQALGVSENFVQITFETHLVISIAYILYRINFFITNFYSNSIGDKSFVTNSS